MHSVCTILRLDVVTYTSDSKACLSDQGLKGLRVHPWTGELTSGPGPLTPTPTPLLHT